MSGQVESEYTTFLSIASREQPQPQPQPQPHPTTWSTGATANARHLQSTRFHRHKQPKPTPAPTATGTSRARAARRLEATRPPAVRTVSGGSSASSRGASKRAISRQLAIINAVSFGIFLANMAAAVVVLVFYSQQASVSRNGSTSRDWISLAIGDGPRCCDSVSKCLDRRCHMDKTTFLAGDKSMGRLACSDWSKESGHCHDNGPTYRLAEAKDQVEIRRPGHYRVYLMATSCEKNKAVNFAISINSVKWVQCSTSNVTASADINAYSRCFLNAMRSLSSGDKVTFSCSDQRCCINSYDRVTHFGLEMLP